MQEVLPERLGVFVDVQFAGASGPEVALAWSQASSEGAAGVHSPVESGSLGVSEAGADSHFVDVAVADQGMPAGTAEEHQAEGAYIRVDRLAGSAEGQEQLSVQAGIPEAVVAQWAEGTAAAASAAVVGVPEFGLGHEWASLVGAQSWGRLPSVGAQRSQLKLQVGQGGVV